MEMANSLVINNVNSKIVKRVIPIQPLPMPSRLTKERNTDCNSIERYAPYIIPKKKNWI